MALHDEHVAALAAGIDKFGLVVRQAAVHRVRLDHDRPIGQRVEHFQETDIAIALASLVNMLIQRVLVLDVDGIRLKLFALLDDRLPPIAPLHVDHWVST